MSASRHCSTGSSAAGSRWSTTRPGVTRDRREGDGADRRSRLSRDRHRRPRRGGAGIARRRACRRRPSARSPMPMSRSSSSTRATASPQPTAISPSWLRRSGKPVVLVANKTEGRADAARRRRSLSARPRRPGADLGRAWRGAGRALRAAGAVRRERSRARRSAAADAPAKPLQLAIVGRPNVGKSTLVNRLIGEERLLTGPEAGITRDAIAVDWDWRGRPIRLVDTAGMRRRPRVEGKLEQLSVADTLRAIRFAETVVLVIDALQPLERQDLTIARHGRRGGPGAGARRQQMGRGRERRRGAEAAARAAVDLAAAACTASPSCRCRG